MALMERSGAWNLAVRRAGSIALGASAFPLVAGSVGALTRSVPVALEVVWMGTVLLATAILATLACMAASGRRAFDGSALGCGWIGGAAISLLSQAVAVVAIAAAWQALAPRGTPARHPRGVRKPQTMPGGDEPPSPGRRQLPGRKDRK